MMMMEGSRQNGSTPAKTLEDIEGMRVAGRLASEVLDYITPYVKPGVTTGYLDKLCHDYMVEVQGTIPAAQLRAAGTPAVSQVRLHLGEPPGLPRRARRQGPAPRRH